jgi:hypothetical protein
MEVCHRLELFFSLARIVPLISHICIVAYMEKWWLGTVLAASVPVRTRSLADARSKADKRLAPKSIDVNQQRLSTSVKIAALPGSRTRLLVRTHKLFFIRDPAYGFVWAASRPLLRRRSVI